MHQTRKLDRYGPFRMTFYRYRTGVQFQWRFSRRDHYLAVKRFLEDLFGGPGSTTGGDDFFVIETEEQYDAMVAFRRRLEREARTGRS